MSETKANQKILVTGATGYIGGRLVPRLLEAGYGVKCLARDPERVRGRLWASAIELVAGDVMIPEMLTAALHSVDTAYYLIHSLHRGKDFANNDAIAAHNFADVAKAAGVRRIIYLGQLGQPEGDASPYMRSRHIVGNILRESGIPVTEFRAGVIVGSGSITFEMIRYLTERWPFLTCPLWAYTLGQPIAVRDILAYLINSLDQPQSADKIIEIGGPDTLTYAEMLLGYSVERGLARWMIPVHLMTPKLSAYWVRMITPISVEVALPLIEEMVSNSVVTDNLAEQLFPNIRPIPYHRAVKLAIERIDTKQVETSWSDALVTSLGETGAPVTLAVTEGFLLERRTKKVDATPAACYKAFTSLGGDVGWLYLNWTWRIRGWMDEVIGGVGLRRGRRHPFEVRVGDAIDFWRVEALEENRLLRMRAEMKVPGKAWLEFQAEPQEDGKTLLSQTAFFEPKGVPGFLYWYGLYVIHSFIFSGMIRKVAQRAKLFFTE
jgi:uncharacterized protein YbjT (DUF2867 family)